jgi:hypothetical protein
MSWALRTFTISAVTVAGFALYGWATDKVAWQGECTVYTARCDRGNWQSNQCTGKLLAGERYRFRVLRPHHEVLFWTAGSTEPSGKYTDCDIEDRRNWTCKANADAARTITLQMVAGHPVPDAGGRTLAFHSIEKWRWWLLRLGIPGGREAID